MTNLKDQLRALPSFPEALETVRFEETPDDPIELFRAWLADAIASGERQPHAMTFATVDTDGRPSLRTLIVKDIDDRGIQVSSSRETRKGRELDADATAAMLFFWRALGRQVEVTGRAVALSAADSADDWRQRPNFTGVDNPAWQLWALEPHRFEFLQATHDRAHTRIEYVRREDQWSKQQLRPSELPPAP